MAQKHKIGVHVSAQQRDNYGVAAPHLVSVVAFDPGAFDEIPDQAIKIFRTHAVHNHKDAPGDFDQLRDDQLPAAAKWWWSEHLEPIFRKIKNQYGDDVYFQPTNEINNRRILLYLDGMIEAAERDGYKLALLGDAGDSPELNEWVEYWLPWLKKHDGKGHLYSRHAYSGVNPDDGSGKPSVYLTKENGEPSDNNTGRPFVEAKMMLENGITMPIVITELGWLAGWNGVPPGWLQDILRYNKLMMAHDNIVGSCLWNAGQWETAPNILAGKPLLDLGNELRTMTPQFYVPGSITPPDTSPVDPAQPVPVPVPTPPTPTPTPPSTPQPPITSTPTPPPSSSSQHPVVVNSRASGPQNYLLLERFRNLEWYDWKLPNGDKSNMQVPVVLDVHNTTGENPFSDGKSWNKFGLAEASYLTTGHNLSPDQKDLYTEYESLVTPGGYVVYKLFSTHAFNATYSADLEVTAGKRYRIETRFFADFAHYQDPKNGNHKKVTNRMDPRHGLVRVWADGYELPHQQIDYMKRQTRGIEFVAKQTGTIKAHWQFISSYAMAPGDGVAGYFITEISTSELETVSTTPTPPPTTTEPSDGDPVFAPYSPTSPLSEINTHAALIIKIGQEETAVAAARLMERYAYDRRRSLTFSIDDMLTLLRAGSSQSIVEIFRPELPSNQEAIERLTAEGYHWREIKLDWGR